MKPEAQKILSMIEGVRLDDAYALDHIDCHVECLAQGKKMVAWPHVVKFVKGTQGEYSRMATVDDPGCAKVEAKFYTRSIDAQEDLRKPEYDVTVDISDKSAACVLVDAKDHMISSPALPTEPLARLHAWVQVWGMEE